MKKSFSIFAIMFVLCVSCAHAQWAVFDASNQSNMIMSLVNDIRKINSMIQTYNTEYQQLKTTIEQIKSLSWDKIKNYYGSDWERMGAEVNDDAMNKFANFNKLDGSQQIAVTSQFCTDTVNSATFADMMTEYKMKKLRKNGVAITDPNGETHEANLGMLYDATAGDYDSVGDWSINSEIAKSAENWWNGFTEDQRKEIIMRFCDDDTIKQNSTFYAGIGWDGKSKLSGAKLANKAWESFRKKVLKMYRKQMRDSYNKGTITKAAWSTDSSVRAANNAAVNSANATAQKISEENVGGSIVQAADSQRTATQANTLAVQNLSDIVARGVAQNAATAIQKSTDKADKTERNFNNVKRWAQIGQQVCPDFTSAY